MSNASERQKIDLPYTYTAGPAQRAALRALRDGRLVGSRHGDRVAVPARPFAPGGAGCEAFVDVPAEGTIEAVTVSRHLPGAPAFALIRIDGASWPLLHRVGDGAEALSHGDRVRAVWRTEREGSIEDISHFAPA